MSRTRLPAPPTGISRAGVGLRARAAAVLAAVLLLGPGLLGPGLLGPFGAPVLLAASTAFGAPRATSTYLQGVTFVQPVDLAAEPTMVELLMTEPGVPGASVTQVAAPSGTGQVELRSTLDTTHGELTTNTTVVGRWRLTFSDGSQQVGPPATVTYADTRFSWRTMSGTVVRLHWYDGDTSFARQAIALGDGAIARAAQLLGVTESTPIDFFIYADQSAFSDALGPGAHENVAGEAHPEIRTMFGLITPDEIGTSEVSRVVEHELTHLVFDTATKNPYHEPLHWLNEGVAVYLSEGYASLYRDAVQGAVADGSIMPLAALTGDFPAAYDRFLLAYGESVSAVDFIIRKYGRDALVRLIRSYAGGVTDDQAFQAALGLDTAAFDASWQASVGAPSPHQFGPQPAPPGPTPSDWTPAGAEAGSSPGGSGAAAPSNVIGSPASHAPAIPESPSGQGGSSDLVGLLGPVGLVAAAILALGALLLAARRRRPEGGGPP